MRLGTRGSALALAQARWVAELLGEDVELVAMTTTGDARSLDAQHTGTRANEIGSPGVGADRGARDKEQWVRELDRALLDGRIDLAVHSAKDVPGRVADGVAIVGVPERADPFDALCGAPSLGALPVGAVVGTSSVRRAAQLRAAREDLSVTELHGNVDTRLRRLADGDYDAIVVAQAGLERLGRADAVDGVLDAFVPAPGQGTLALTARARDTEAKRAALAVTDLRAAAALAAERALVVALDADCDTPVGAHCTVDGDRLTLRAFVGRADGSAWLRDELSVTGLAPEALGARVADRLNAAGAQAVLGRA